MIPSLYQFDAICKFVHGCPFTQLIVNCFIVIFKIAEGKVENEKYMWSFAVMDICVNVSILFSKQEVHCKIDNDNQHYLLNLGN